MKMLRILLIKEYIDNLFLLSFDQEVDMNLKEISEEW
jgi:hypothetical protein